MVGGNVDRIHGRDLYSAARPSRRNCLITIVTPAVYPRFLDFLHVDIQSTGRTLSRQPNDAMSEIECAQLHSELFRRRHSTRQSHGLFALAKHLLISDIRAVWRSALSARVPECQKLKCRVDLDGTEHFEM